jgi:hypothetical protein
MTVKEIINQLSKFPPDLRVFQYDTQSDHVFYQEVRRIKEGYFSEDSEGLYFDIDDAIESESDDWGGELEEVVVIK